MRWLPLVAVAAAAEAALVLAAGCSGSACTDCGPCGLAGSWEREVDVRGLGFDSAGGLAFASVQWNLRDGQCNRTNEYRGAVYAVDLVAGHELARRDLSGGAAGRLAVAGGEVIDVPSCPQCDLSQAPTPPLVYFRMSAAPPFTITSAALPATAIDVVSVANEAFLLLSDGTVMAHTATADTPVFSGALSIAAAGATVLVGSSGAAAALAVPSGAVTTWSLPGCFVTSLAPVGAGHIVADCWYVPPMDIDVSTGAITTPVPGDCFDVFGSLDAPIGLASCPQGSFAYVPGVGSIGAVSVAEPTSAAFVGSSHLFAASSLGGPLYVFALTTAGAAATQLTDYTAYAITAPMPGGALLGLGDRNYTLSAGVEEMRLQGGNPPVLLSQPP